jgi:hypothetical protein
LLNGAAPTVSGSTITGYARAIDISGGSSPVITGNHIAGAHDDSGTGFGVVVQDSTATITGNVIDAPAGAVFGVSVIEESGPTAAAATLKRNRIIGSGAAGSGGVASSNSQGLVTLDGDIIAGWDVGLLGTDVLPDNPDVGDMDATNVTVADNATNQAQLNATKLTLDSSIIGDGGAPFGGLLGTCTADYSRLPATNPCTATNPTSDPPLFVNPAGRDYHLQAGSTLIDAGNPAAPADPIDFDGDPRVMDGPDLGGCYLTDLADTAVRDIGADEHNCVPRTFVTKAPPSVTSTDTIKFKFRSDDPAATFQCKKDKKRYKPCSSPWVRHYGIGTHLVQIRAVDAQGQKDATPAKRRFRVV